MGDSITKRDLAYLQTKTNCYLTPMVYVIGRAFSWFAKEVYDGCRFDEIISIYKNGRLIWYAEEDYAHNTKKRCSDFVINHPKYSNAVRNKFVRKSKPFLKFTSSIHKQNLSKLSNKQLYSLLDRFYKEYELLYRWGEPLPWLTKEKLAEYMEGYLLTKIKNKGNADYYLNVLASPNEISFVRREELDLLKIALNKEDFDKKIETHTKKYCWVPYDYGVGLWDKKHFMGELKKIKTPEKEIKKINEYCNSLKKEQKQAYKKLKIDKKHRLIFEAQKDFAFLMDYKKEVFTKSHYHLRPLLEEIAKRVKLSRKLLQFALKEEVKDALLKNKKLNKKKLQGRHDICVCIYGKKGSFKLIEGKEAEQFIKKYIDKKEEFSEVKEIKGNIASKGFYKGKARVILNAKNIKKVKTGDVLVATMTSPDYTLGMKKAGAIVTDEGGITCHAAIVSRELGIPCIIGTKIATKVLKTGDLIEVNANHGVVRIIKRINKKNAKNQKI